MANSFFVPSDSGRYEPTENLPGPWHPGMMHGGPPSALMAHAILDFAESGGAGAPTPPDPLLTRLGVEFVRPVPVEPVRVECRLLRPGKRVALVEAVMTAGDQEVMRANGWPRAEEWAKGANTIAPTLVGGSKKHGGPDLGPTRARNAWAALGVNGKSLAEDAPDAAFEGMPRLTVKMAAAQRTSMNPQERGDEVGAWWDRIHQPGFSDEWDRQVDDAVRTAATRATLIASAREDHIATLERQLGSMPHEIERLADDVARLEADNRDLHRLTAAEANRADAAERTIDELVRSRSWRLTAPLRAVRRPGR